MRRLSLFLALLLVPAAALAAGGEVKSLKVTVLKVYLKNAAGDWILAAEPKKEFDLIPEGALIPIPNDGRVPPGSYVNAKLVLSETLRFKGTDNAGNLTKEGGRLRLGGNPETSEEMKELVLSALEQPSPTWNKEAMGEVVETIDFDHEDRDDVMEIYGRRDFSRALVVKPSSAIEVSLGLDSYNRVFYAWPDFFSGIQSSEVMYYLPPKDVSELAAKVDASGAVLSPEDIEWTF